MRPGTVYLHVLVVATIVSVIGLASIRLSRLGLQDNDVRVDIAKARLLADAALQITTQELAEDIDWRENHEHGKWTDAQDLGEGKFSYMLDDESSQDLEDDDDNRVRLHIRAAVGNAVRCVSADLDELVAERYDNILKNADMEQGVNNFSVTGSGGNVNANGSNEYEGNLCLFVNNRSAKTDALMQDVTSEVINGEDYIASGWVKTPFDQRVAIGLWIVSSANPSGSAITASGTAGSDWTYLSDRITAEWEGTLYAAYFIVVPYDTTSSFYADLVGLEAYDKNIAFRLVRGSVRDEPLNLVLSDGTDARADGLDIDLGIIEISLGF